MTRIIVVIQVRSDSKRLPRKALLPIAGVPMLVYLIRRLRALPASYKIVVATTENKRDDAIVGLAQQEKVSVVRGEEEDVLSRYMRCVGIFPCDIVVRITADNPLTDPDVIIRAVEKMAGEDCDYVRAVEGFPVGTGADVFNAKTLSILNEKAGPGYEREHIDAYILKHMTEFKTGALRPGKKFYDPDLRFTVDDREDYEKVRRIVESYPAGAFIKVEDAIK